MRPGATRKIFIPLIIFLLYPSGLQAKGGVGPLSITEYRSRINQCLKRLQSGPERMGPEEIRFFKEKFPAGLEIDNGAAAPVLVDRVWIHKATDPDRAREETIAHLQALLGQISQEPGAAASNWKQSRTILDRIYRTSEFRHLEAPGSSSWGAFVQRIILRFWRWLQERLDSLALGTGEKIHYLACGAVLLLGTLVLVWLLRYFKPAGWNRKRSLPSLSLPSASIQTNWTVWREQARQLARKRAFREAIRALFISALMEGHQRGWWVYRPEDTNMEHLAGVKGVRHQALARLIEVYERTWYGLGRPGAEEYHRCEEWLRRLEAAS